MDAYLGDERPEGESRRVSQDILKTQLLDLMVL
jgi:hypothetical protein